MNNMTTVYESLSSNNSFVSLSGTPGSNDDDEQSEFNDVDVDEEVEDKSYKSCDDNESTTNLMMNKSGHSRRSRISKTGSKRSTRSKRSKGTSSGGSRSRRSVGSSYLELKGNNMLEFESEDADVSSDGSSFDEDEKNSISRFLQGYRDNRDSDDDDSDGYDTDTDNDEEDGIRFINTTIQLPHNAKATAAANSAKARLLTMPFSKSNNNYDFFSSPSSGRRKTRNKRHSRRRRNNGNEGLLSSNRNIIYILCGAILLSLSYYLIDISTRRQQNDTQRFIINKYRHKNNLMLRSSSGESNSTQLGIYNNVPQKNSGVIVLGAPFSGESILTYALAMGGFRLASSNEMNSLKDILQLPENHRRKKKKKSKHTKKKKTHDRYEPSMYSDKYSKEEEEGDEDTIPPHIEPFERQDFHDENDILLSDQGLSWDSHRIYEFDDKTANARIRRENFLENSQILSFLNGGESDTDPWIWQDPQVCITLNPWMKVLQHLGTQQKLEEENNDNTTTTTTKTKTLPPDAAAIITFKNPFDMAHSLHSNFPHQISFLKGLQIWLDYNFKCMTNILDLGICFIATFHSTLIGDPLHEVNRIMKDLDYACHISPGYPGLLGHDAAKQIMNDMESMEVPFVLPYRKATSTISSSTSATTEINNVIVEESEEALNEEDLVTVHSLNYIKQEKEEEEDDELDKEEEEGEEDWEREIILDALGILDIFQDRDFLNCEHSSINHDNNNNDDGYHSSSYNYDPETEFSYLDPDFVEETELQQQNLNPEGAKNKDEIHTWGSIHLSEVIEELSQLENEHLLSSSSSSANTGSSEKGSYDSNMEAALKFRQQRLSLETKFKNELSNWVGKSEADAFHQLIHLEQEMTNQYVNDGLIGVGSSTTSLSSSGGGVQQQQNDMLLQTQLKIREERVNLIQKYRKNIRRGVLEAQKVYCDLKNGKAFKRTYLWPQEEHEQNN